jgi:hypothetical protein
VAKIAIFQFPLSASRARFRKKDAFFWFVMVFSPFCTI